MKKDITVTIQVNWGSDFQEEFLESSLEILLNAWKVFAESKHKQNKITYEIDKHNGYKTVQH